MKLNCKQGDLAIIVSSTCGNEGKIVRCLRGAYASHIPDLKGDVWRYANGARWVWRIDRAINFGNALDVVQVMYCSDDRLRPLRGDATDEELETSKELSTVV